MFREMRRGKQLLSMEETVAVIDRCTNGVLVCLVIIPRTPSALLVK